MSGVLAYQAPEQIYALGDRSRHTPEADVFSLGVIAYELLSGRLPFQPSGDAGATAEQSFRAQLFDDPVPLSELDALMTEQQYQDFLKSIS